MTLRLNQSVEPTVTSRAFTFCMTRASSLLAPLALGCRRSSYFRLMVRAIRAYAVGYPFLLIGSFLLTWVAARLSLGHWPRPYFDDPKSIGPWVEVPYSITGVFFNLGLPAFVAALAALLYYAFRDASQRRYFLTAAAVSVLLMIAAISFLWWDPLQIVAWFMD